MGTVCFGKKDPFDAYDQQIALSKQYKIPLIYFFLYRHQTEFDRTIKPGHPLFVSLLQKLNTQAVSYGLHPSYFTSDSEELLNKEVKVFAKDSGKDVICSRQHYLRFNIRTTPLQLQNAGIKFDFSMGFASAAGFRACTGLPFYYYDLNSENGLDIMAVPFAVMDGAYYIYDKVSMNEVKDDLMGLSHQLKQVNGLFITVFHDRTFSKELYPGWSELYSELHKCLGN